jgi:hypothetical protein
MALAISDKERDANKARAKGDPRVLKKLADAQGRLAKLTAANTKASDKKEKVK